MAATTLEALFVQELSDIYNAELQLATVLPRLERAAANPVLAQTFKAQMAETLLQVERLASAAAAEGLALLPARCRAMEGWVEEGADMAEALERGPVLDAALVGMAQKVAHYEIASYGTLCALAAQLGHKEALALLSETLLEEKEADRKLTVLAKANIPRPEDPEKAMLFRLAELADS
jgi:ferritin-like metal-binding protein YciE